MPRTDATREKCLTPGCNRQVHKDGRGLCQTCVLIRRIEIKAKPRREKWLIDHDLILPKKQLGRPSRK
jgi:hypothetical protein